MQDKLFNPDYLKSLCREYGLLPSKKYGQNFLVSPEVIDKITEAAAIKKSDTVVEVGPGFGVLTFALAERAEKVIAFEIERKLQAYWQDRKPENVNIIWGNVLRTPLLAREGFGESPPDSTPALLLPRGGGYKVVANLPYQITSPVIREFLESKNPPESMTLMVQKEVAERICAEAGDMSLLSVAVQYYADPEIIASVSRQNFWPEPKVDSAIVRLSLPSRKHKQLQESDGPAVFPPSAREGGRGEREFFLVVKAGFSNRRKLLIKNLIPIIGKKNKDALKEIFSSLGLKETARAQELSVGQWQKLAMQIYQLI